MIIFCLQVLCILSGLILLFNDEKVFLDLHQQAGIAQLGERQTEDLKVACSIHAHRTKRFFFQKKLWLGNQRLIYLSFVKFYDIVI